MKKIANRSLFDPPKPELALDSGLESESDLNHSRGNRFPSQPRNRLQGLGSFFATFAMEFRAFGRDVQRDAIATRRREREFLEDEVDVVSGADVQIPHAEQLADDIGVGRVRFVYRK